MFGIGFQELLIILVLLVVYLLLVPLVTYLIASLFLRGLKFSPRRALLACWLLAIIFAAVVYTVDRNLSAFIVTAIFAPLGIALNIGWLWLMGSLWRLVGLSRLGTTWRNMATLLFRAVRPAAA